jgi:Fic family protein
METIFAAWDSITITENPIKQLHRDLLRNSEKDNRHRGDYKTAHNNVVAFDTDGNQVGVIFETATPFDTPRLMGETTVNRTLHPLNAIGIFTVVFLEIHPFQHGNGRLSRVLTTLLLLRAGYSYVPYSSLESVIEQSKEGYYLALRQTQGTIRTDAPNWSPWLSYFVRSLRQHMHSLRAKVEREREHIAQLPKLAVDIVALLKEHGRLSIGETTTLTGASRNTLKNHFKQLMAQGTIEMHGKGRATGYRLK